MKTYHAILVAEFEVEAENIVQAKHAIRRIRACGEVRAVVRKKHERDATKYTVTKKSEKVIMNGLEQAVEGTVGRKITEVKLNKFRTGVPESPWSSDPYIYLDDGSYLTFAVSETVTGDSGITMTRWKDGKRL